MKKNHFLTSLIAQLDEKLRGNAVQKWLSNKSDYWRYSDISIAKNVVQTWLKIWEDGGKINDEMSAKISEETNKQKPGQQTSLRSCQDFQSMSEKIEGYLLVIKNGMFDPELSQLPEKNLLIVKTLPDLLRENVFLEEFQENFSQQYNNFHPEDIPMLWIFLRLTLSRPETYTHIKVADHSQWNKPLYVAYFDDENVKKDLLSSHLHLEMGQDSSANIIELHKKKHTNAHFHHFTLSLKKNAVLKHFYHLADAEKTHHHHRMEIFFQESAKLIHYNFLEKTQVATLQRHAVINAQHADCQMYGLYDLDKEQNIDYLLSVDHQIGDSHSEQHFKGILYDKAKVSFTSNVYVAKQAQNVASSQLNQSLLFGEKAHVNTRPQLEINADDVKCAHGATVGPVDTEQIFYLRSRGISEKMANKMLSQAFVRDFEEQMLQTFNYSDAFFPKNLLQKKENDFS